jgi:hypothetical protein
MGKRRMSFAEASAKTRPEIIVGMFYPFYSELEQETFPWNERDRRFSGTAVQVISMDDSENIEGNPIHIYTVRAHDGSTFVALDEELNGWDFDLGQYFLAVEVAA